MSKGLKIILAVIVMIVIVMGASTVFLGLNPLALPKILISSIYGNQQIAKQLAEAERRKINPPTQEQLEQMKNDPKLCFDNDDCRENPDNLVDCNGPSTNKYYECRSSSSLDGPDSYCLSTLIGCSRDYYMICENNSCKRNSL